jgi:hypothetical protein
VTHHFPSTTTTLHSLDDNFSRLLVQNHSTMSHEASDEKQSTPPPSLTTTTSVPLTESPNSVGTEHSERSDTPPDGSETTSPTNPTSFVIIPPDQYSFQRQQANAPASFHPYTRPLTVSDLDSVVALENASFSNPAERASPEKVYDPVSSFCLCENLDYYHVPLNILHSLPPLSFVAE